MEQIIWIGILICILHSAVFSGLNLAFFSINPFGFIIAELKKSMLQETDAAIDNDIALLWTDRHKQVITGADLLGRLLRGIDAKSLQENIAPE